ncbi:ATP/GTP-binding protein [Streptomyces xiamenensis]|uniref:GTP-binding protein n=1 Tax=Streptomyces xiamenensis TaxID=408015 RepID=UPI0036F0F0E2
MAGGFGTGKTTFIGSVSEVPVVGTESEMTRDSVPVDDASATPDKTSTTVLMDFGRRTLPPDDTIVLYLFGTPGQSRFLSQWQDIARGAIGALVLVDPRRLDASFEALDLVERSGMPYAVAANVFPGAEDVPEPTLRRHLDLAAHTPLVSCRATDADSSLGALIVLAEHALHQAQRQQQAGALEGAS